MPDVTVNYKEFIEDPLTTCVEFFNEAEDYYQQNIVERAVENWQYLHLRSSALDERAALEEESRFSVFIPELHNIVETRQSQTLRRVLSVDPPFKVAPLDPNAPEADHAADFQQKIFMACLRDLWANGLGRSWQLRLLAHIQNIEVMPYGIIKVAVEERRSRRAKSNGTSYPTFENGVLYRLPAFYDVPIYHFRFDPWCTNLAEGRYAAQIEMLSLGEIKNRDNPDEATIQQLKDQGASGYDVWEDRFRQETDKASPSLGRGGKYMRVEMWAVIYDDDGLEKVWKVAFVPGAQAQATGHTNKKGAILLQKRESPYRGIRLPFKESRARTIANEFEGFSTIDIGKPLQLIASELVNMGLDNLAFINRPMVEVNKKLLDPRYLAEKEFRHQFGGVVETVGDPGTQAIRPIHVPTMNLEYTMQFFRLVIERLQAITAGEEILQGTTGERSEPTAFQANAKLENVGARLGETTGRAIEETLVWLFHFYRNILIDFIGVPGEAGLKFFSPGLNSLLAEARENPNLLLVDTKVDVPGLSGYDTQQINKAMWLRRYEMLSKSPLFAQNLEGLLVLTDLYLQSDERFSESDRQELLSAATEGVKAQRMREMAAAVNAGGGPPINGKGGTPAPRIMMKGAPNG